MSAGYLQWKQFYDQVISPCKGDVIKLISKFFTQEIYFM